MTSLAPHYPTFDFDQDASPTRLVNDTQLDLQLQRGFTRNNAILAILDSFFRSDDTPRDEHVDLRHLSDEVRLAIASEGGWLVKAAVDLMATGNVTLAGEQTIDGTVTSTSRVLLTEQTDASENGIWNTSSGAWTRATDANTAALLGMAFVYVVGGTVNTGTYWLQTITTAEITLETTDLVWARAGGTTETTASQVLVPGSATLRSLGDRFGEVVNVKDHGAVGGGVTDDTAAIDAAAAVADATGRPLFFPFDSYLTDGGHVITSGIRVFGDGAIIKIANDSAVAFTFTGAGAKVDHLHFQGGATAYVGTHFALDFNNATGGGTVEHCRFSGTAANKAFDAAIYATLQPNMIIRNCRVDRILLYHVRILDGDNAIIQGNHFIRDVSISGSYGRVSALGPATITGNFLSGSTISGGDATKHGANISGNTLVGATNAVDYYSIDVYGLSGVVSANICALNGGVRCNGNITVADNLIYNPARDGIRFQGSGTLVYIARGNFILNAGQETIDTYSGIYVNAAATATVLDGNVIQGATQPKYAVDLTALSGSVADAVRLTNNTLTKGATGRIGLPTNQSTFGTSNKKIIKATYSYQYFAAASTTADKNIAYLPAGWKIKAVTIKHKVAFAGGIITAVTIGLGIASNPVKYAAAFDVFQAVGDTVFQDTNTTGIESFANQTTLVARATSVGANLDAATAGVVEFFIEIEDLGAL